MKVHAIEFFERYSTQEGLNHNGVENYYLDNLTFLESVEELIQLNEYLGRKSMAYSAYLAFDLVSPPILNTLVVNQFESVMYIHKNDDIFNGKKVIEVELPFLKSENLRSYWSSFDNYNILYVLPEVKDFSQPILTQEDDKLTITNKDVKIVLPSILAEKGLKFAPALSQARFSVTGIEKYSSVTGLKLQKNNDVDEGEVLNFLKDTASLVYHCRLINDKIKLVEIDFASKLFEKLEPEYEEGNWLVATDGSFIISFHRFGFTFINMDKKE